MAAAFLPSRIPPTSSPQPPPSSIGNSFQSCLPSAPPTSTAAHRSPPPPPPESTFVRHPRSPSIPNHATASLPPPPSAAASHHPWITPRGLACRRCLPLMLPAPDPGHSPVARPASHLLLLQHDSSSLPLSLSSKSADLFCCELSAWLSPPPLLRESHGET